MTPLRVSIKFGMNFYHAPDPISGNNCIVPYILFFVGEADSVSSCELTVIESVRNSLDFLLEKCKPLSHLLIFVRFIHSVVRIL